MREPAEPSNDVLVDPCVTERLASERRAELDAEQLAGVILGMLERKD